MLRTVSVVKYLQPLRQGGSLPAIVEADDGQLYAMKFVGAGQGPKALIAEVLAGELGRALGLRVPELVLLDQAAGFGDSEPDPEIQDLLRASAGLNLGLRYLPGALDFSPSVGRQPDALEASAIVWFDSLVTNVDRTPRNCNLLVWQEQLWLIDHGACLYVHHDWQSPQERSRSHFPYVKNHVLLPLASALAEIDADLSQRVTPTLVGALVEQVPSAWLAAPSPFPDIASQRQAYIDFLLGRREASAGFVEEAQHARTQLL